MIYKLLDLFSGLGGFSLGLERTNHFKTIAFCENNTKRHKILNKNFPGIPIWNDIKTLSKGNLDAANLYPTSICGGFPCQELSSAGRPHNVQVGFNGSRSSLFGQIIRIIREYDRAIELVILENVRELLRGSSEQPGEWFAAVLRSFYEIGYNVEWDSLRASDIGSIQKRERVIIIAYPSGQRMPGSLKSINFSSPGQRWSGSAADMQALCDNPFQPGHSWPQPLIRRVDDGSKDWMDRIEACGNGIHPSIAEIAGKLALKTQGIES